jgi:hypothetical protein
VAKDILDKFVFLTGTASFCFAQSTPDDNHVWFVERLIRKLGATDLRRERQPCDLGKVSTSVDIIVFVRGELRKQRREYVIALVNLIESDTFRQYLVVTEDEYTSDIQNRRVLSLKIAQEVESGQREGYGVLTLTDEPLPACIVTPSRIADVEGLKELLLRERSVISMKLVPQWQFVEMNIGDAFFALMKQQCGYVAGEASVLRNLLQALRRERKLPEFAPLWFETDEVAKKAAEVIRKKDEESREEEGKKEIAKAQKENIERKLRRENGPKAQALREYMHTLAKAAAEKPEQLSAQAERLFPEYSTWARRRFSEKWETTEVTSDVEDFGSVEWNGRPLDGILVKTVVAQKNRVLGAYETDCFIFGLVNDVEFGMQRDPLALKCGNSSRSIATWKVRRHFKSKWNWEQQS